jgi:ABC-type taurine transport system substrate-binding protein
VISANYIFNGATNEMLSDDFVACEKFLDTSLNEFDIEYLNYQTHVNTLTLECSIMNTVMDDETKLLIEDANSNIVSKLGEKLIEMGKKFIEYIEKKINEIKDKFFKYKNNEKKLAELIKKHPEMGKEKIKLMCDEGALDFSDMKSLAEMDREFMKIVKLAKEGEEDPDTLRAKWNNVKKKWISDDDKVTQITKVAGAATAVITLVVLVKTFGPKIAESRKKMQEEKLDQQRTNAEIMQALESSGFKKNQGYFTTILAMNRERQGKHMQAIGEHLNAINKLENMLASAADKVAGTKGINKMEGIQKNNAYIKDMLDKKDRDTVANQQFAKDLGSKMFKDTLDYEKMKKREKAVAAAVGDYSGLNDNDIKILKSMISKNKNRKRRR